MMTATVPAAIMTSATGVPAAAKVTTASSEMRSSTTAEVAAASSAEVRSASTPGVASAAAEA